MVELYGKSWSKREVYARVGRLEQLGGIRRMELKEGKEKGVEQIQVRTGAGLCYYVSPDRGLDISLAEMAGIPLSWQSPNGDVSPAYYEDKDTEWLRTAAGGLLMTCGMSNVGAPCTDEGQTLGLHGSLHHTPAKEISAFGEWQQDQYIMRIRGIMEETKIFGENLRLTREICSRLGKNSIHITDTVENHGFESQPLMMLYHFNFGFPLMSESTELSFPSTNVQSRDKGSSIEGYDQWQSPTRGYSERVYYHECDPQSTVAQMTIHNPSFPFYPQEGPLSVQLRWNTRNLPRFVQWKMPGEGIHVLGIEPSNCGVEGRLVEEERGTLVYLEPGEQLQYDIEIQVK